LQQSPRKIGKNQVRAIGVMLSGSPDDMKRIEEAGHLNDWCVDSVDWLEKTFGADNLVSAVLHRDETTPHIHATIVPVVTGERRKAKEEKLIEGKKKLIVIFPAYLIYLLITSSFTDLYMIICIFAKTCQDIRFQQLGCLQKR
jgi:hypothetical protein